ncbi:MAG: hypothetical protein ACD_20C00387G0001, partial [uncultured bacterium]
LAVWADGTALLTEKEFNELFDAAIKEQPELQGMAPSFMPIIKQNLLNSLVQYKIIAKYIEEKGLDKTKEYLEKLEQISKAVKQKVNVDFFVKEFESSVSEKEKKDYYDKNKDRFALVARGGVKASGVKFDKEADAQEFLGKVAGKVAEFDKLVKADAKLTKAMQDFAYVNEDSRQIDQILKNGILSIAKAPVVTIIKVDDKNFWVVKATEKKASQYRSYEELKDQLENAVKQSKQGEALMKKLTELQQKYGVKVKEAIFAPAQDEKAMQAALAEGSDSEDDAEQFAQDDSQEVEKTTKAA